MRGVLDSWGRAAAYVTVFSLSGPADRPQQPSMIAASADRFVDAEHARQAMSGQRDMLQYARRPVYSQSTFTAPRLGEQSTAVRMFTTDEHGVEMVVYSITLRQDALVAGVSTFALLYKDDRGAHAIRLARLVLERMSARMK